MTTDTTSKRTPYPLKLDDGGRNLSKRPRQVNDCVVRALAIITEERYDDVYDHLSKAGREPCQGFDLYAYLRRRTSFMGHPFGWTTHRYTISIDDVLDAYPKGRILIETGDHVFASIDGQAHDLIREPGTKRVYRVWRFD